MHASHTDCTLEDVLWLLTSAYFPSVWVLRLPPDTLQGLGPRRNEMSNSQRTGLLSRARLRRLKTRKVAQAADPSSQGELVCVPCLVRAALTARGCTRLHIGNMTRLWTCIAAAAFVTLLSASSAFAQAGAHIKSGARAAPRALPIAATISAGCCCDVFLARKRMNCTLSVHASLQKRSVRSAA